MESQIICSSVCSIPVLIIFVKGGHKVAILGCQLDYNQCGWTHTYEGFFLSHLKWENPRLLWIFGGRRPPSICWQPVWRTRKEEAVTLGLSSRTSAGRSIPHWPHSRLWVPEGHGDQLRCLVLWTDFGISVGRQPL